MKNHIIILKPETIKDISAAIGKANKAYNDSVQFIIIPDIDAESLENNWDTFEVREKKTLGQVACEAYFGDNEGNRWQNYPEDFRKKWEASAKGVKAYKD